MPGSRERNQSPKTDTFETKGTGEGSPGVKKKVTPESKGTELNEGETWGPPPHTTVGRVKNLGKDRGKIGHLGTARKDKPTDIKEGYACELHYHFKNRTQIAKLQERKKRQKKKTDAGLAFNTDLSG